MIKEAMLYKKIGASGVECCLCAHRCKIADSKFGICNVRQNIKGKLHTHAYGEIIAAHMDPIEKKPLYHFLPATGAYSIATSGCNFKCGFCQNWEISQPAMRSVVADDRYKLSPGQIVEQAIAHNAVSIAYTYTEPTIFFEYAYDIAKIASEKGIYNIFVTNGYMTTKALKKIHPFLNACNVDLKSFSDETYKSVCGGSLAPVLDSIKFMKKLGLWIEVTTLIIPGMNDSEEELTKIVDFIVGVGKEIPWHISRFYPNYKYTDILPTPPETLLKAKQIGKEKGLQYIYLGNTVNDAESDTMCYNCGKLLIKRSFYAVAENHIKDGACPDCKSNIAGVWV